MLLHDSDEIQMEGGKYRAVVVETEKSPRFASLVAITSGKTLRIFDFNCRSPVYRPVVLYATRGQPAMLYGRNSFMLISHEFLSVF